MSEFANRACPPRDGDQWRVNFSRVGWEVDVQDGKYAKVPGKPEDNWVWSPQGVIDMHRPERWGYVQFSNSKPGAESFRADPTWPAREMLMRIYYAQREFKEKNKRWGVKLEELGLSEPVTLEVTKDGWQAAVSTKDVRGRTVKLHVRQDSQIWVE